MSAPEGACQGTSSYDCKLQTCHGLPQCGTCCKCTGVCILEERNKEKTKPPSRGDLVYTTPQQMAEALDGFLWQVVIDGDTYNATFTGQVNYHGNLELKLGKKHTKLTPAPATGVTQL